MDLWCPNEDCPEHHLPKSNPFGVAAADAVCGSCGSALEDAEGEPAVSTETEPSPQPEPAPEPEPEPAPEPEPPEEG